MLRHCRLVGHAAALVVVLVRAVHHEERLHVGDEALDGLEQLGVVIVDAVVGLERRLDHAGLQRVRDLQRHREHVLAWHVARRPLDVGRGEELRGQRVRDVPQVVVVRVVVAERRVHEELDHVVDHGRLVRRLRRRVGAPPVARLEEGGELLVLGAVKLVGDGRGELAHKLLEDARGEAVVERAVLGHAAVLGLEALHDVPRQVALKGDRLCVLDDVDEALARHRPHVHDRAVEDRLETPRLVDEHDVAGERLDPVEEPVRRVEVLVHEHHLRLGEQVAVGEVHADLVRRDERARRDALGEHPLVRAVVDRDLRLAVGLDHLDRHAADAVLVRVEVELHVGRLVEVRLALAALREQREVAHRHLLLVVHLRARGKQRAAAQLLGDRAPVGRARGHLGAVVLERARKDGALGVGRPAQNLGAEARVEHVIEELVGKRRPDHPRWRRRREARAQDLKEGGRRLLEGVRGHRGQDLVALERLDLVGHLGAVPPAELVALRARKSACGAAPWTAPASRTRCGRR
mmetsp:Transcript_16777/g.52134  ORF Transcript_16777/g.52134 Transcript_16777/m.52134 type:complete len:520 (-) Transcript_16777:1016-2575(-)